MSGSSRARTVGGREHEVTLSVSFVQAVDPRKLRAICWGAPLCAPPPTLLAAECVLRVKATIGVICIRSHSWEGAAVLWVNAWWPA